VCGCVAVCLNAFLRLSERLTLRLPVHETPALAVSFLYTVRSFQCVALSFSSFFSSTMYHHTIYVRSRTSRGFALLYLATPRDDQLTQHQRHLLFLSYGSSMLIGWLGGGGVAYGVSGFVLLLSGFDMKLCVLKRETEKGEEIVYYDRSGRRE
jgi:hypothetical protein